MTGEKKYIITQEQIATLNWGINNRLLLRARKLLTEDLEELKEEDKK